MRTRIKFRMFPGDYSKAVLIRMLESRRPFWAFPWVRMGPNAIRSFRRMREMRERAVLKRQTARIIEEQTEE